MNALQVSLRSPPNEWRNIPLDTRIREEDAQILDHKYNMKKEGNLGFTRYNGWQDH